MKGVKGRRRVVVGGGKIDVIRKNSLSARVIRQRCAIPAAAGQEKDETKDPEQLAVGARPNNGTSTAGRIDKWTAFAQKESKFAGKRGVRSFYSGRRHLKSGNSKPRKRHQELQKLCPRSSHQMGMHRRLNQHCFYENKVIYLR